MFGGSESIEPRKIDKLNEAFEFLEAFMGDSMWMAGDIITIADYSVVATVSTIEVSELCHKKLSSLLSSRSLLIIIIIFFYGICDRVLLTFTFRPAVLIYPSM